MNQSNEQPAPPAAIVFWVIWFAIFNGLFILLFFVGGGIPKGQNEGDAPLALIAVAGALASVSMVIRFIVIPKLNAIEKLLPAMIIGLALAESVGIVGIFVIGKEFRPISVVLMVREHRTKVGPSGVQVIGGLEISLWTSELNELICELPAT